MNPILVLQKRLDVAVTEIQELRIHADELQEQLNSRTAILEQKLKSVTEKQADSEKSIRVHIDSLNLKRQEVWMHSSDDGAEQEMKTPTSFDSFSSRECGLPQAVSINDTKLPCQDNMPGHYELSDGEEDAILWSWPQTQDFLIWSLAMMLKDNNFILQLTLLMSLALVMCFTSTSNMSCDLAANLVCMAPMNENVTSTLNTWFEHVDFVVQAAIELRSQLDGKQKNVTDVLAEEGATDRVKNYGVIDLEGQTEEHVLGCDVQIVV